MKNKPSILIISSWYPSEENSIEGSFVHEQVRMLQKNGHEVVVVKPNLSGTFVQTIKGKRIKDRKYTFEGVVIFEVGVNVYLPRLKPYYYTKLSKKVISTLKKNNVNFDLIHSHSLLSAGIIAPKISKNVQKSLIHTEHTSGLIYNPEQFDKTDRKAIEKLVQHAKNVFFVSQYAKEHSVVYKDINSATITVLNNVVDELFFSHPFIEKKNQVIVIGEFSTRKNQLFLLDVWKRMQNLTSDMSVQLIFAGKGFDSPRFLNYSENVSNIRTLPQLNRWEVVQMIAESKIVLSSSKLESFGLTIAEALALGTPVVVTDSGGAREIVEEGDGFIVDFDKMSFLEKVEEVLKGNHDKAAIIRERCKSKFSENVIYLKLVEAYKNSVSQ